MYISSVIQVEAFTRLSTIMNAWTNRECWEIAYCTEVVLTSSRIASALSLVEGWGEHRTGTLNHPHWLELMYMNNE